MEYGLNRRERIDVRVSPEELEILKRVAGNEGVTVSDYLRWMGLWAALWAGDRGARRLAWERLSANVREERQRFYAALRLPVLRWLRRTKRAEVA